MKILITSDLYFTATNGVVTSIRNLSDELTRRGHDVRILTLSNREASYREGAVYYVRSAPFGVVYPDVRVSMAYKSHLIKELIAWKPDIIHSQCEFSTFSFASFIAKRTGAPLVHTYHTMYEDYVGYVTPLIGFGKAVIKGFTRFRLNRTQAVIAPTKKVEQLLKRYEIRTPITVIPSGISLEAHKKAIDSEALLEKKRTLGIATDAPVMINLGRLGTEKNVNELLTLFAKAKEKHPTLIFLIVGDGPAREALQKQAREQGITDAVIFTGMVKPTEVHFYYRLGDVFVSASTSETQGLTYLEATANGLPLVCRDDPCLDGIIDEGENGFAYRTEEDFLAAIDKVITDPFWRSSAKARSLSIAALHDKVYFGDHVERVYRSLLK